MKKISLVIIGLTLIFFASQAQIESNHPTATPNAASLGVFGQIPVDYFTGTPEINIPLYTYTSRDISVPIGLSYHSGNFRPSDHSSWVGLGWALQAGGMITRIQNDLPDELVDYGCSPAGTLNGIKRGFFYNYGALANSGWNSVSNTEAVEFAYKFEVENPGSCQAHERVDYAPDEFEFSFMGMSGSMVMTQSGNWALKEKGGATFSVQTEIGPYMLLEPNFLSDGVHNFPSLIRSCLTRFILTAGDGTRYYFGSDSAINAYNYSSDVTIQHYTTPDSTAVEFARVGAGYGNVGAPGRDGGTVPMTWLLTKILSPTGDSVVLRYTRDGPQVMAPMTTASGSYSICSACEPTSQFTYGAGDVISILDASTLSSIMGANGSVQFGKSRANLLDYTILGGPNAPQNTAWVNLYTAYVTELFQGSSQYQAGGNPSVFMELDNLAVQDNNGNLIKSYVFNYNKSSTNRMWLDSVTGKGADGTTLPPYSFSYNNITGLNSVPYNTVSIDHWGYYTAKDPFAGLFQSVSVEPTYLNPSTGKVSGVYVDATVNLLDSGYFNAAFNTIYTANRNPVTSTQQYGILQQITYPTGGSSQFVWEPNQYSKCMNGAVNAGQTSVLFSVQDLGANVNGPGVRIKQIISQANYNAPAMTKTYTYYRDLVNKNYTSSGVLNSAQPSYCDEYDGTGLFFRDWSSQNVNATHYTDGSPMTYTNVQELNSDGSFKTFTYSNQDNGYMDWNPSDAFVSGFPSLAPEVQSLSLTSMELGRGLLLQENSYGASSTLLLHHGYQYNNDPTRFQDSINRYTYEKKFSLSGQVIAFDDGGFLTVGSSGGFAYYGDITSAVTIHTYYPYLQSDTVTQYDQNGTNPMSVVSNYTYDPKYRNKITKSFTSSKGEPVVTTYNYAANTISGLSTAAQQAQTAMVGAGMVGIPLETIETRSGIQTTHQRTDYQNYTDSNTFLVPANSYQSSYGQPMDSATRFINYDAKGNIAEYMNRDGLTTCLDWGYNKAYPTVKVVNAVNTLTSYPVVTPTTGGSVLFWAANNFSMQQASFTVGNAGSIILSGGFGGQPGTGDQYLFAYTLTGPVSESGWLCICSSPSSCPSYPSSITFPDMPPGNYALQVYTTSSNSMAADFVYSYPENIIVWTNGGAKNYFYDGFEENTNAAVVTGTAHTGKKYWGGSSSYSSGFSPPDNNTYIIEWWALQNGTWVYQTQTYNIFMGITGPIDDVRIFPAGSMMSTYTYQPLVGMTSEIDPSGYTTYYEYDAFGRLSAVLDKDRNVLKQYCYRYTGQSGSCPLYTAPPQ